MTGEQPGKVKGCGQADGAARARRITEGLPSGGILLTDSGSRSPFRISPAPFPLPRETVNTLARQGRLWLGFLKAAQEIYFRGTRGEAPAFVVEYLDTGKPERLVEFGRMNRFRAKFPPIIRPDIMLTDDGLAACELDSVPGGFGLLDCLSRLYAAEGCIPVGGAGGMASGFMRAMAHASGRENPAIAIAVSEESRMYLPEMRWMAEMASKNGGWCRAVSPMDLQAGPDGVRLEGVRIDAIYRFFELFDLPNLPVAEELFTAAKMKQVVMAPPPKAFLEEKILLALLHHPALAALWEECMGEPEFLELKSLVIPTWVLDSRPIPPHAVVAGFLAGGKPVSSWQELGRLTQREREFVVKPSGFSADAWGSHGVSFGQDLSRGDWMEAVGEALEAFPEGPHVIQPFRRPAVVPVQWLDAASGEIRTGEGRVRLTPYYFVTGAEEAELSGILATICPTDKKAVHGMPDAVMVPCITEPE
jgi:hypothetical protein